MFSTLRLLSRYAHPAKQTIVVAWQPEKDAPRQNCSRMIILAADILPIFRFDARNLFLITATENEKEKEIGSRTYIKMKYTLCIIS